MNEEKNTSQGLKPTPSAIYATIVSLVFAAFVVVFITFPRSTYSELEKRDLATFPEFTAERLFSGVFTDSVSKWFSDSEPFRDELMTLSMTVRDKIRLTVDEEEQITFIAGDPATDSSESADAPEELSEEERAAGVVPDELSEENAKIAHAGIVVVGTGERVRAMVAFGGGPNCCLRYAELANKYKETFSDVNVYSMIIPTSIEYYCPEKVKRAAKSQRAPIENAMNHLAEGVQAVDVYWTLKEHALEPIYLRTDHHWTPLGAFYAAKKFAKVAGVPFPDLDAYEEHVIHQFVGSMYGYSRDISVKNAPEDFIYYTPRDVSYETTYVNYTLDRNYHITREGQPYSGPFFYKFRDGNGAAYSTFMGSDQKLTVVRTSTHNGRRVLIVKDSFGNALPGYMFYSFEEVHVVDMRYFRKNMKEYVSDNGITDILFANNIFKAATPDTYDLCVRFLTQNSSTVRPTEAHPADNTPTGSPAPAAETPAVEQEEAPRPGEDAPAAGEAPEVVE